MTIQSTVGWLKEKRTQKKNYQNEIEVKLQRSCSGVDSLYPRTYAIGEQNEHYLYLRKGRSFSNSSARSDLSSDFNNIQSFRTNTEEKTP